MFSLCALGEEESRKRNTFEVSEPPKKGKLRPCAAQNKNKKSNMHVGIARCLSLREAPCDISRLSQQGTACITCSRAKCFCKAEEGAKAPWPSVRSLTRSLARFASLFGLFVKTCFSHTQEAHTPRRTQSHIQQCTAAFKAIAGYLSAASPHLSVETDRRSG